MGSGRSKAAAVNLHVITTTHWRDTLSKLTTATSTIEISSTNPTLMLAMELVKEKWKLGFGCAFGQPPLVRNRVRDRGRHCFPRDRVGEEAKLGLAADVRVVSCYEAGRDGFWLHRFLSVRAWRT